MRWVKRILVVLIILGFAAGAYATFLVRRSFPTVDGTIEAHGLAQPVEVIRDAWGVPHIYAATPHDLFFAQGYTHAQERFWQMDFWRHIGSARLTEMFGEDQLGSDVFLRSLGFVDLAQQELEWMPEAMREILEWYSEGVNAYLSQHSGIAVSLEYAILPLETPDYVIEPWTPINTLTWGKVMSWDLSGNMRDEIDRTILAKTLPLERLEELYPPYPDQHPVIVIQDTPAAGGGRPEVLVPDEAIPSLAAAGEAARRVWATTGGGFEGIGSNNWVVDGSMTSSGAPLLADDPHLAIQMPSIWFANGLHCTGDPSICPYQLVGFSFPGSPGVIIGHNDHIAWGVTNQTTDTQDLYVERLNPDDPGQYEVDGEWVDFDVRTETFVMPGGEDVTFDVLSTRHGPVISGTFIDEGALDETTVFDTTGPYVVALAWQTLEPSTLVEAIIGINIARNHDDFRAAATKWDIAAQNLVYADVAGNIAYQATGEVPKRSKGDGRYPVPGWSSEYAWEGWVPFEELPWMLNPERGWIETANQPVNRPGAEPFIAVEGSHGYRAARVEELLQAGTDHTVETFQKMQMDSREGGAGHLVPYILEVPSAGNGAVESIQEVLGFWSSGRDAFQARGDSAGAAAYFATWRHLLANTFNDELPESHYPYGGGRFFEVVRNLLDDPSNLWWDDVSTVPIEERDDILFQSMIESHEELIDLLGSNTVEWSWGDLHIARFENQTFGQSGIAPIEWLFNRTAPGRVGGSDSVVNAVGWHAALGFQVDWVPSARMVVDLGDLGASTYIHTTGQSGHAFHGHYDDLLEPWTDGEHIPMLWTRDQVVANAETTLRLVP